MFPSSECESTKKHVELKSTQALNSVQQRVPFLLAENPARPRARRAVALRVRLALRFQGHQYTGNELLVIRGAHVSFIGVRVHQEVRKLRQPRVSPWAFFFSRRESFVLVSRSGFHRVAFTSLRLPLPARWIRTRRGRAARRQRIARARPPRRVARRRIRRRASVFAAAGSSAGQGPPRASYEKTRRRRRALRPRYTKAPAPPKTKTPRRDRRILLLLLRRRRTFCRPRRARARARAPRRGALGVRGGPRGISRGASQAPAATRRPRRQTGRRSGGGTRAATRGRRRPRRRGRSGWGRRRVLVARSPRAR